MQGFGSHLAEIYVFDVGVSEHINEFRYDYIFLEYFLSALFVESDVYNYSHGIENQVSESMVKDNSQSFQECGVVHELIAENSMPGEIRQDSHCLYLNFFILSRQNIEFDAVENWRSDIIVQKFFLWNIVKQDIGYAWNSIQYKLFVFVNGSLVYGLNQSRN